MFMGDSRSGRGPGFMPFQDFSFVARGSGLDARCGLLGMRITGRRDGTGQLGQFEYEEGTVGDASGYYFWKNAADRAIGSWREVFPTVISSSLGGSTSPPAITPSKAETSFTYTTATFTDLNGTRASIDYGEGGSSGFADGTPFPGISPGKFVVSPGAPASSLPAGAISGGGSVGVGVIPGGSVGVGGAFPGFAGVPNPLGGTWPWPGFTGAPNPLGGTWPWPRFSGGSGGGAGAPSGGDAGAGIFGIGNPNAGKKKKSGGAHGNGGPYGAKMTPVTPSGSGTGSVITRMSPTKSDWREDLGYESKQPIGPMRNGLPEWPSFPKGFHGLTVQATDVDKQTEMFMPVDPRLIAPNNGGVPQMGTLVADVAPTREVDIARMAPLQSLVRVVPKPSGQFTLKGAQGNALAWNIGISGLWDSMGGFVVDDNGSGSAFTAVVSVRGGGPFDVAGPCKHVIGQTSEGDPITPLHFSKDMLIRGFGVDGPLDFRNLEVPADQIENGPWTQKVFLGWDPNAKHTIPRDTLETSYPGRWAWWTHGTTGLEDEDPPAITPSGPGGGGGGSTTPSGGGGSPTPGGEPGPPPTGSPGSPGPGNGNGQPGFDIQIGDVLTGYPFNPGVPVPIPVPKKFVAGMSADVNRTDARASTHLEFQAPVLSGRAMLVSPESPDLAHDPNPNLDDFDRWLNNSPVTWKAYTYGEQDSSSSDPMAGGASTHVHTQEPGASRSRGGTGDGGLVFTNPEVGLQDAGDDFAPAGVTKSTTHVVMAPGVNLALGKPDLSSGGLLDAHKMSEQSGDLVVDRVDSSGTEAEALRLKSDGNADMTLGDSAGATKFAVKDLGGVEVASVDSDGDATFTSLSTPTGGALTQTYATADATHAARTYSAPATLTDNSGGTSGGNTIAAITDGANAGSADLSTVQDAIATLAAKVNALISEVENLSVDHLDTAAFLNYIADQLQAGKLPT